MKIHKLKTCNMGYFEYENDYRTTYSGTIDDSSIENSVNKLAKNFSNLLDELDLSTEQILKITESRYEAL